MSTRRARRRPGENRARLLEAGLIEFGLFGYLGASTSAIAARAEVSQPHLYTNFAKKQDLFLACLTSAVDLLLCDDADLDLESASDLSHDPNRVLYARLMVFQAIAVVCLEEISTSVLKEIDRLRMGLDSSAYAGLLHAAASDLLGE